MTRRQVKLLALRMLKAVGAFRAARWITRRRLRILGYHGIWRGDARFPGDGLFMLPATFRRRLVLLRDLGYPVVPLEVALDGLTGILPLPPCAVVITIDDAWLGTAVEMRPALRAAGMPATLYADTRKLLSGGTIEHVAERYVARYGAHAREAYPSGKCDPALKGVLRTAGVQSASTVRRALARPADDPHFLPRFLDSERISEIEFEAELAGVLDLLLLRRRDVETVRNGNRRSSEPPQRLATARSV